MTTALGAKTEDSWSNIIAGKSGINSIPPSLFAANDLACRIAGYIPSIEENSAIGFNPEDWISKKDIRTMDRFIHLAMAATQQAIDDSGYKAETEQAKQRTGIVIGSGIGGLISIEKHAHILERDGARRVSPFFIPASLVNLIPGHVAIKYGFQGPNYSIVTACASGAHSIGEAAKSIIMNETDVMVAGGAEGAICRLGIAGFAAARALSTKYNETPTAASRPWDKGRDGFVMGEGAGVLVLEELEHAQSRGAKIYGELVGYGLSGDAHHITAPEKNGDGAFRAMAMALQHGSVSVDEIDYINAHGTSTPLGDMIELKAIKRAFGSKKPTISSTKSAIGHLLGAAGSVEAVISVLAMVNNVIPPTLNLNEPEEEAQEFDLTPLKAKQQNVDCVMSNSFGFGGTNSSLIFRKI